MPKDPERWNGSGKRDVNYSYLWKGKAVFYVSQGGTYLDDISLDMDEVTLYRDKTGDGQTYGIIVPEGDSAALLDAPGGNKVNHLYFEDQAKVLEENGSWLKVETAYGTGWIARNELTVVEEQP